MRIALAVVATLSISLTLSASESFSGTWKLDVAKSKLCQDVASATMKITETGPNTYHSIIDEVSKSGRASREENNRFIDGREHPVPGQPGVTEAVRGIDASTHQIARKKDGKVILQLTAVVSQDGKVLTVHRTLPCEETAVYDRQ